jgi:hypothetical protein
MGALVIGADMFRELGRLREAERHLKNGEYPEALATARDPALVEHRRAVEVRAAARQALLDAARALLREGKISEASARLEHVRRDGPGDGLEELEKACRDARRTEQASEAARAAAIKDARRAARTGDRAAALRLIEGLGSDEAALIRRECSEADAREAAWASEIRRAVESRDFAAVEKAMDAPASASSRTEVFAELFRGALEAAVHAGDAAVAVRLGGKLRDRGVEPGACGAKLSALALEQARRALADADLSRAAALLGWFPEGGPSDELATELRRGLWAWQRGREAFRRGQDAAGDRLYEEADRYCPPSAVRKRERADAATAARVIREAASEARKLCIQGRLRAARERLVLALGEAPADHVARELLAALDLDLSRDDEALAEAKEALAGLDLRTARRIAAGLSLRRADLAEVELLLHEVEARADRALLDAVDAERRLVVSATPKKAAPPGTGRALPAGEPFLLRVENEGDWLVHPGASLWIGSSAKRQADLRLLAAIGARHARIARGVRPDGGIDFSVTAGEGQPLAVNRTETTQAVLRDGDLVQLGRAVAFTFLRPGDKGSSACLKFLGDFAVHGAARIVLFGEDGRHGSLVAGGPESAAHLRLRGADERFEIFRGESGDDAGRLFLRSPLGVSADGAGERAQVRAAAGVVYAVGALKFYLDPVPPDRE